MLDLVTILSRRRMFYSQDGDTGIEGFTNNRLFGLNDLLMKYSKPEWTVCELGAHVGTSTLLFAYYCQKVWSVDSWEKIGEDYVPEFEYAFDQYVFTSGCENVMKVKGTTDAAAEYFQDNMFDLVYVDADHSYEAVKKDILHYIPQIQHQQ